MDLFGFTGTTSPTIAPSSMPNLLNASFGFAEWWAIYAPGHARKVGKQKCLNLWAKNSLASNASHIKAYTLWMMQSPDWTKDSRSFIPMPATFLARAGWEDWSPEPERPKKASELDRLKAHKGAPMPASVIELKNRIRGMV